MYGFTELLTAIILWCQVESPSYQDNCRQVMVKCVQESGQNYDSGLEQCVTDAEYFNWEFGKRKEVYRYMNNEHDLRI